MEWYTIVTTVLTVLSIPTLFGLVWRDLYEKKKSDNAANKGRKEKEELEMLRHAIKEEIKPLNQKIDKMGEKLDKVGDGTKCTLRNDILKFYYECCAKGFRNDDDYQDMIKLYEAYTALGGNSFISEIMKQFDKLPTEASIDRGERNSKIAQKKEKNEDDSE